MALPSKKKDTPFTFGEYLTWPDDERWEIIDGVPMAMVPAPSPRHQRILGALYRQFYKGDAARGPAGCEVFLAPFDVRLPESNESDDEIINVVQPDLSVICDPSRLDDRGYRGAPDLIIEVFSPSSGRNDLITKRVLYERHGVREYWVVQPMEQIAIVYLLTSGSFDEGTVYTEEDEVSLHVLPGVTINLKEVFTT